MIGFLLATYRGSPLALTRGGERALAEIAGPVVALGRSCGAIGFSGL
jgi:hypothetical protein